MSYTRIMIINTVIPCSKEEVTRRRTRKNRDDKDENISSFVCHRLISTHSVGAMLSSMAQLRRGQLRMVVDVVGSC